MCLTRGYLLEFVTPAGKVTKGPSCVDGNHIHVTQFLHIFVVNLVDVHSGYKTMELCGKSGLLCFTNEY